MLPCRWIYAAFTDKPGLLEECSGMKAKLLPSLLLICLMQQSPSAEPARLKVHEWGTFTVLSGSDGVPLNWFQGPGFVDELPPFVQFNTRTGLTKAGAGTLNLTGGQPQGAAVRMETPVIYFYPEKPMRVSVSATFYGGELTEWFPSPKRIQNTATPLQPLTWEGELLPPSDPQAQSQIPGVPAGKGDHYRHAREVPDAWIFRSSTKGKDADKFIFYRGKGQSAPPFRAQAGRDGSVRLMHWGPGGAIPHAFALTVRDGSAQWSRMPQLEATTDADASTHYAHVSTRRDLPVVSIDKAAGDLATAMQEALVATGLTYDEARAMVATWNGHWFREPGTRVLAILPSRWVDSVLPLTIKPGPQKLARVFVARFEVFTPEREEALLALLNANDEAKPGSVQSSGFQNLQLGRFAHGALLRALNMQNQQMSGRFANLQQAITPQTAEISPATAAR